jgi:hypothetical protein
MAVDSRIPVKKRLWNVEDHGLAPGLRGAPPFCPRRDLSLAPQPSTAVALDRRGDTPLVGDLVGALLANAEKLSDLDEANALAG